MRKLLLAATAAAALSCFATTAFAADAESFVQCRATEAVAGPDMLPSNDGLSVPSRTTMGEKSVADIGANMARLNAWLRTEAPAAKGPGVQVTATRAELHSIGDADCPECELLRSEERRFLVGVAKPVGLDVDLGPLAKSGSGSIARGALSRTADGGFAWALTLRSPGAHALRVGFSGLDLPDSAELYVYNENAEAFGPYAGTGIGGEGTLVANTITGDTVTVQLRYYGAPRSEDLARLRFQVAEVGHIGSRFQLARQVNAKVRASSKSFCSYNATCVQNGDCYTSSTWAPIDSVRKGVAHMLFQSGQGFYICSGSLLNNTSGNGRPLFLTANHCISKSGEANSLETFWDFRSPCNQTAACDFSYTQMRSQFPTTLGATLLAHGTAGDYSLSELSAVPGGTRTYLGYSTSAVSNTNGLDLFRLSHPQGAPQSFSRQDVTSTSFTCGTLPRGNFIYSADSLGATEGGSSGSAVLNTAGQVVGQLYGACGSNLNDVCDSSANRTVDGALAAYYPNVSTYLNPSGGGGSIVAHVSNITLTRTQANGNRTRATATVTVLNASNQPVSGATVSGSFSGFYAGTASGTTNASGVATLNSGNERGSGAISFCVTGIGGTNISYNSAANTETCDSAQ